jgi:SAM-dependent methyltransferase
METINCVLCGGDGSADPIVITENGWNGRQCKECGLIYISPRPSLEETIKLYSQDAVERYSEEFGACEDYLRYRSAYTVKKLMRYVKSGDLLEIGAAHGVFCEEVRKAGFKPFAIEFNPLEAASIVSLGIPCEQRPVHDAFPGLSFDAIYHCDLTSHLHDIVGDFRAMADRLRPGGIMIFETGNLGDVRPKHYSLFSKFDYPDHLFFLSLKSLRLLIEKSGFEILSISSYSLLAQLAIRYLKKKVMGAPGSQRPVEGGDAGEPSAGAGGSRASVKSRLKDYINFTLRYRMGRIMPSTHVPATQIVVVRKAKS